MSERQTWHVDHLDIVDEPMLLSMLKYRQYEDRQPDDTDANVVSSNVIGTRRHLPIIDLDFPHRYIPSSTPGHGHLYLDFPEGGISFWRLFWLLWGLRQAKAIERGYFWWSIRRGGTFVRRPGVRKTRAEESVKYTYGLLFKLRKPKP